MGRDGTEAGDQASSFPIASFIARQMRNWTQGVEVLHVCMDKWGWSPRRRRLLTWVSNLAILVGDGLGSRTPWGSRFTELASS